MIFCNKLIFGLQCLSSMATQVPTTTCAFGLGTLVFVTASSMLNNVGALLDSSAWSLSHLNSFRSAFDWLHRKECALSEVITRISLRICIPTSSTICFQTQGFFMLSTATVFWVLRATAFPRCFRRGVKTYVWFLHPTCIYEMKYECILCEETGICL